MSQTWSADTYAGSNTAATDLQNIENNFATLKSSFSGASAPGNTEWGMLWADSTQKVLKLRDDSDSAWVGLMHGDTSQKIPVYRNTAMDGWAIDSSSATDKVVALKGGSTYTTGGTNAGSWTISGFSTHTHKWYDKQASNTHDQTYNSTGTAIDIDRTVSAKDNGKFSIRTEPAIRGPDQDWYTDLHTPSHDGTWRISAAIFTLQYLDL